MPKWIRLCSRQDFPSRGHVASMEAGGQTICVANVDDDFRAVGDVCPHAGASLSQGWLDGNNIVCPAHCWTFDLSTGVAQEPERATIAIFSVCVENEEVLVNIP